MDNKTYEELKAIALKYNLKQLTYGRGVDDLYLCPLRGAHTIPDIITLRENMPNATIVTVLKNREPIMSEAMSIRNERCIDEYGCAAYG